MFYSEAIEKLNSSRVKYLVAGGMAVNLHGVPRTTMDLDIIIDMERENIIKLITALKELGYRPRLPVPPEDLADEEKRRVWIEEKNLIAFTFVHKDAPAQEIDVLISSPVDFKTAYKDKIVREAEGLTIPAVGINSLIKMKQAAGRLTDHSDVEMLKKVRRIKQRGLDL